MIITINKNIKRMLVLLLAFTSFTPSDSANIYVSPSGSDTNSGTIDSKLRTPHAALQMAREWRRLGDARINGGINIILDKGIYFMDRPLYLRPEDSGTEQSPTIIEGKGAVISGGVPIEGWQKQGYLWVADAPTHTIRQLWVGGEWAVRATQFGKNKMERMIDFNTSNKTITIPTPKNFDQLAKSKQLEMTVHQRWATAILRVKKMTAQGSKTIVEFKEPESHLEFSHPWPQPVIGGEMGNSSYCLTNAMPLLDEPGEWLHDAEEGKIYYYPKKGEEIGKTSIVAAVKEQLMIIEGCSMDMVENIEVKGIAFEYTSWNKPSAQGHVTLQGGFALIDAYKLKVPGLPWAAQLENQAWVERPQAAVQARYARQIRFSNCSFSNIAATALDYAEGISHSDISTCNFTGIGGTAIMAGSFAEGPTEVHMPYIYANDSIKYCHNISIKDNKVKDATLEDWGAMGIGCGYVRDTRISDNIVDGVNWSGICIGWGWTPKDCGMRNNHITDNKVVNFALQMHDSGAIYTMSAQPGSTITGNYTDKMGEAPYATNERAFYIYLDAETDGYTITGNYCPEKRFGDNNPGPNIKYGDNGKNIKTKYNN